MRSYKIPTVTMEQPIRRIESQQPYCKKIKMKRIGPLEKRSIPRKSSIRILPKIGLSSCSYKDKSSSIMIDSNLPNTVLRVHSKMIRIKRKRNRRYLRSLLLDKLRIQTKNLSKKKGPKTKSKPKIN